MKRTKMDNTNNNHNDSNENHKYKKIEIEELDGVSVHELMNTKTNGGLTYNGKKIFI
jgi:hypothetical protein